ncbi:MAG TPA: zinc ribbon domain-containing protein [Anaerolineaceae bacterium]|nr:zinc ribbon domain-containing protein [Anaerolineaceae bacterium]
MRRWIAILISISLLLAFPGRGQAQAGLTLASLQVDLWPEYDRPTMLVILHLELPASLPLPQPITLRIPTAAGDPYNVATRQQDGQLYNVEFTRTVEEKWSLVSFQADAAEIQVEYYDPLFTKNGAGRAYTFQWPGDFAASAAVIDFQQPVDARDIRFSLPVNSVQQGVNGLTYHQIFLGELQQGQEVTLTLSYQKGDDALTRPTAAVMASAPLDASTPGRAPAANTIMTWVAIVLLVAAAGVVGGWYLRAARSSRPTAAARLARRRAHPMVIEPSTDGLIFCHKCGRQAKLGDDYCRSCGTLLRKDV